MGYPMAGHLKKKKGNHTVTVYNRTAAKAEKWSPNTAAVRLTLRKKPLPDRKSSSPASAMTTTCGRSTLGPDGAFAGMTRGTIFVDHSTTSAEVARELHATAKEHGIDFIDAPVSGGQAGAENGVLTVMCGGESEPYRKAEPVIASYARTSKLLGPSGAGQLAKMVNQIGIAGVVQGLAEGLHFCQRAGLDVEAVIEVISKGAAGSWQMENRHRP